MHDVDEDIAAIPYLGGSWTYEIQVGIAYRNMRYPSNHNADYVAYKDKNTTLSSRMVFLVI